MKCTDQTSKRWASYTWASFAAASVLAVALAGCGGGGGGSSTGNLTSIPVGGTTVATPTGAPPGPTVPTGTPISLAAADAATIAAITPTVVVGGASINSPPMVTFSVAGGANNTNPITGLGWKKTNTTGTTIPTLTNMAFSIAKQIPMQKDATGRITAPARWVNYIVTTIPTRKSATDNTEVAPTTPLQKPNTETQGTLTDYGNGIYTYQFYRDITKVKEIAAAATLTGNYSLADLDDLTYDPTAVHRITIVISGNAWGTGTQTANGADSGVTAVPMANPTNAVYDFIPASGKAVAATDSNRDIVSTTKCNECHGSFANLNIHGGSRLDTKYCVVCHTEQRKLNTTAAVIAGTVYSSSNRTNDGFSSGNFPGFIHRVHKGEMLGYTGYSYGGVAFNEITYPQDIRNCVKCHDGTTGAANATASGDNYMKVPNRMACGGCHDTVKFSDGTNHEGGALADDTKCSFCHEAASIKAYHVPTTAPNANNIFQYSAATTQKALYALNSKYSANTNASYLAAPGGNLPSGASTITYLINKVTVAKGVPSIEFKYQKNGSDVVFNTSTGTNEMMTGFVGSPSIYFAFAMTQDGITYPLDWNATVSAYLKRIWDGTATGVGQATQAGTLTGPAAGTGTDKGTGWYTVTLTGVKIPTSASMIIGGIGYTYGLGNPYTAGNGLAPADYIQPALVTAPTAYAGTTAWTPFLTTTQPITQTDVSSTTKSLTNVTRAYAYNSTTRQGGVSVPPHNQWMLATVTGADTGVPTQAARRAIVSTDKCNACHNALGVFTESTFHAGQRNDAETCTLCHNVNRVNSGWGVNIKEAVHAIHAGSKREQRFSWEASTGAKYWDITYPNAVNNCEACHIAGTYDFSATANAAASTSNRLLWTTMATGTYDNNPPAATVVAGNAYKAPYSIPAKTSTTAVPTVGYFDTVISPWVSASTPYGVGFSFTASTSTTKAPTQADGNTLVSSPIASACFSCHDTSTAKSHIESQGGKLYVKRSTVTTSGAFNNTETCTFCHASSTQPSLNIKTVHANFK